MKEQNKPLELDEALAIFDSWASLRGLSEETIRGYKIDSRQFAKYISQTVTNPIYINDISDQHIEEFMHFLVGEKKCSPATVNRKLNTLKMFFRCMKRKKLILEDPVEETERMKVVEKEMNYLTHQELRKILNSIDHPTLYYFALTMAFTGIRVSECKKLKLEDIDFQEHSLKVINGKGGKHRTIPLHLTLSDELVSYLQYHRPTTNSPYFFALKRSGTVSTQYLNQILRNASQKAGIRKHITSHTLRHSFASYLAKQNTNIVIIQKLLGHASLKTTSIYLHVQQDELKEAVGQIKY